MKRISLVIILLIILLMALPAAAADEKLPAPEDLTVTVRKSYNDLATDYCMTITWKGQPNVKSYRVLIRKTSRYGGGVPDMTEGKRQLSSTWNDYESLRLPGEPGELPVDVYRAFKCAFSGGQKLVVRVRAYNPAVAGEAGYGRLSNKVKIKLSALD